MMVLAQMEQDISGRVTVPVSLLCPLRGPLLIYSVILWVLRLGPERSLATSDLEESKAAEMCTTDGRNYVAHLTSEIFPPLFLLSLSFPQITPRLRKLIDSLCKWSFEL